MNQYQTALKQLSKQKEDIVSFHSTPSPTLSPVSPTTTNSKRPKCTIPEDLDLQNVYNPSYNVIQLISTRKRPRKQAIPPRPPNSFFLFKNCYMLELRKLGYRFCMPDVCRQSKLIWSSIPATVKDRYDNLALQAQILHQEMYPGYKFQPKKRQIFKSHVFSPESVVDSSMLNTFSVTNFLGDTTKDATTENIENTENTTNSQSSELLSPPATPVTPSSSSSSPTVPSIPSSFSSPIVASPVSPLCYATDNPVTDPLLLFPFDLVYPENLLEYDLNSFNNVPDVMIPNQSISSSPDDNNSFLDEFTFYQNNTFINY